MKLGEVGETGELASTNSEPTMEMKVAEVALAMALVILVLPVGEERERE